MRLTHTFLLAVLLLWPASLLAQVPELALPDLASPDARQRALADAHASLKRAIGNARAGTVILTRAAKGDGFIPIDRAAWEASLAVQIKSGQLTEAQGQALRQQTLSNHAAIIAEAEAYAAKVGAALPANSPSQGGAANTGVGTQGELPCEFLRQSPTENIQRSGLACQLLIGNPLKADQAFVLGTSDGPARCDSVRNEFRASFGSGSATTVREVPGLGEFGFEGPSRDMYGIAFCRNGYAFFGMADAKAPASVHAALMARAKLVDARLQGLGAPGPAAPCNPPATGALADGSAAALTLRSGECVSGVLIDMGGADYTIRTREGERRVPLDQVAVIDFTTGGSTEGNPPAGQHLLIRRNGQRATGRLFDLRDRTPLTVDFDASSGRQSWSSNDVDRVVLWAVPASGATNPGVGAMPRATCAALSGDWRRNDNMVIRVSQSASAQQGFILEQGATGNLFRVGEQTLTVDGSPQPGICTGQVLFRFGDGRSEWRATRITMNGSNVFDTDNAGQWIRVGSTGAAPGTPGSGGAGSPGGTPAGPPPSTSMPLATCAALAGDWRRNDGMVIRIVPRGATMQGTIHELGSIGPLFRVGEPTLTVEGSPQPGVCTSQAMFRFSDGRTEWRATRITLNGPNLFDTDIAGQWIRVGTTGAAAGTPGGIPGATTGRGGSVLGTWRGCDGRMNQFVQSGDEIIGRYTALGGLPPSIFAIGDVSHRLRETGPGLYEGFVEHRFFDGRREWMKTSVTIDGDSYKDTGSDSCSVALTRVGAATAAVPPSVSSPAQSSPQAPPAQPPAAQIYVGFAGDWDTVNGSIRTVMRLQQQGNRVTGTYDYQQGMMLGIVVGNTLYVTWTHGTPNAYMGSAQFTLSADGRSFSGPWAASTQQGTWSGTRR